jgi:hypothetical protein
VVLLRKGPSLTFTEGKLFEQHCCLKCINKKCFSEQGCVAIINGARGREPTIHTGKRTSHRYGHGSQHALSRILVPDLPREARDIVIVLSYHVPTVLSI